MSVKAALVTGAASGIGLATAELLARAGVRVALNGLPDDRRLDDQIQRLTAQGLSVVAAPGDVSDPAGAAQMVERAINTLGGLNYLVNNAGTPGTPTPIA